MDNTLIRSEHCSDCGAEMLWTQNAWSIGVGTQAAYRCAHGHVMDPTTTRQCPACGVHDTCLVDEADGRQRFRCSRCRTAFQFPR
jgi:hypothetical protein